MQEKIKTNHALTFTEFYSIYSSITFNQGFKHMARFPESVRQEAQSSPLHNFTKYDNYRNIIPIFLLHHRFFSP